MDARKALDVAWIASLVILVASIAALYMPVVTKMPEMLRFAKSAESNVGISVATVALGSMIAVMALFPSTATMVVVWTGRLGRAWSAVLYNVTGILLMTLALFAFVVHGALALSGLAVLDTRIATALVYTAAASGLALFALPVVSAIIGTGRRV